MFDPRLIFASVRILAPVAHLLRTDFLQRLRWLNLDLQRCTDLADPRPRLVVCLHRLSCYYVRACWRTGAPCHRTDVHQHLYATEKLIRYGLLSQGNSCIKDWQTSTSVAATPTNAQRVLSRSAHSSCPSGPSQRVHTSGGSLKYGMRMTPFSGGALSSRSGVIPPTCLC